MLRKLIIIVFVASVVYILGVGSSGCAVIVPPTGGWKDSIAPKLINASPSDKALNVTSKTITLQFDEYVDLEDAYSKITISPTQKLQPEITKKLKTVSIKLKDSLEPNTTYQIAINGAIKDVNEGNKLEDYFFVFSTGKAIDSNTISGNVLLAETGKIDSNLVVVLHTDMTDSAIAKKSPRFSTKLRGDGSFTFRYLPSKPFNLFVLQDDGGQKKYTNETQIFAFANAAIDASTNPKNIKLYAFAESKILPKPTIERSDIKLKITNSTVNNEQDILRNLTIISNKKLIGFESNKIIIADTNYRPISNATATIDSTSKIVTINHKWQLGGSYKLIVDKDFATDEKKQTILKNDTISFSVKKATDYGKLIIRLNDVDIAKNPVLIIKQGEEEVHSLPINAFKITIPQILPGEYEMYLLYDTNKNKKWDSGNYWKKIQPEIVVSLNKKITIKADWENEIEIMEKL
jgi:uncharacterized protein (UPF0333 family)